MKRINTISFIISTFIFSSLSIATPTVHAHVSDDTTATHATTSHEKDTNHNDASEHKASDATSAKNVTKTTSLRRASESKTTTAATANSEKTLTPSTHAALDSVKRFFTEQSTATTKKTSLNGYQAINFSRDPNLKGQQAAMIAALVVQSNNDMSANGNLSPKDIKFNQAELEKKFADPTSKFYISYVNALNKINQVKNLSPAQELFGPHQLSKNTKIIQGSEGDCYFLSAVNGLLQTPNGATQLESMIKKVPGKPDEFRVKFPDLSNGTKGPEVLVQLTDAEIGMYSHVEKGGKWLAILSVAEAKQLGGSDSQNPYAKRLDPEAMMNGGYPSQTLSLLTGNTSYTSKTLPSGKITPDQAANVMTLIKTAETTNMPIAISTTDHVLAIIGCENCVIHKTGNKITSVTGKVLIKNPWGSNNIVYDPKSGAWTSVSNTSSTKKGPHYLMDHNGVFSVPFDQINNGFAYLTYATTPTTPATSSSSS